MNDPRLELLAPAGDEAALRAAVQNGADAVYLGTGAFNARRNAGNFDGDALDAAVRYCHARGVKVHVTLNTLVREDEFDALVRAVRAINHSGADAVIVQDFGVVRALRQIAPDIQLHASTQMAVHNRQGVRFLRQQGFDRAVLARELTYGEMAECAGEGIEIETFAHGALCVACSGQCLMSSLVGGRSGNRGLCAQPCRLPWKLDGRQGYLLSTRDLCAIDDLARLRDAGVCSLKIEGRLKRAEYVAVTVAAYRRAIDALYANREIDTASARAELAQMFNRGGFTRGYGPGVAESDLMYPQRPNHIGVAVGACREAGRVRLTEAVDREDALALRRGDGEDMPVRLAGAAGESVACPQARKGDALYRLVSAAQIDAARQSFANERRAIPVKARATLRVGREARLWASDGACEAEAVGDVVQAATGRGLDPARARAQLTKTGGTPYAVADLEIDGDENAFCPASMLNALRRDALAALEDARTAVARREGSYDAPRLPEAGAESPLLLAQSADPRLLMEALRHGADAAVLAPADIRPGALARIDVDALRGEGALRLALPAVAGGEALNGLNAWALENRECFDATYISNLGQLALDWPGARVGDYMLNAASNAAVAQLRDWGLRAVTASVELTARQAGALRGDVELIAWGRIPLMHLRHCPLRAAEGMKGRHADCRHCDGCAPGARLDGKALQDRRGAAFPLRRLAQPGGCVIQVLNSVPLMPLRHLDRLPKAAAWRLLLDVGDDAAALVALYRAALDGKDFKALPQWRRVDAMDTTTGHYFRGVE